MINVKSALFNSMAFSVCSLFFLLTAIFLLFYKMKHNTERKKLYIIVLTLTFLVITLEIATAFTIMNKDSIPVINEVICRTYLFLMFIWTIVFVRYMYSYKKDFNEKNFYISGIIGTIILLIICILLPLEFTTNNIYVIKGPIVIILDIYTSFFSFYEISLVLLKKVDMKNISTIPLFMGIILYFFIALYQILSGNYINIITLMYTLVIIDLFYSTESQDYQLLEEFSQSKVQSEILNKNRDEFLSNMSKEIRTPMSNIIGLSDLILMNTNNTVETVRVDGQKIYKESINLLAVINNILDLARFEANKEEIIENDYKFEEFVLDINNYVVNKYHITPVYRFADNLPNELFGDNSKLKKIITLTMDSELKNGNVDSMNIEYGYSTITNDNITFNISFTFVYKSSASYNTKNELDLEESIVNLCSKLINCNIVKSDSNDFKSIYNITITQAIKGSSKLENILVKLSKSGKEEDLEEFDFSNKKVLVVDDSQININIVKRLFSKYNFVLDEALNGQVCIDLVSKNKYDLIFLDEMMPGLSGTDTLRELKSRYSDIPPVIALTANSYDGLKEKYMADGFTDYLSKPIEAQKMHKILTTFLNDGGDNNAL